MNDKWEQRKLLLNRDKMLKNMAEIQDLIFEISKCAFNPKDKDVDKFTDFKEYAKDYLKLIKIPD